MLFRKSSLAAIAGIVAIGAAATVHAQKPAVDWGTPGNAVPCDAWEKNAVAELWSTTKPVTINGKRVAMLTLGRGAMSVGDTNVWQIVETACGGQRG